MPGNADSARKNARREATAKLKQMWSAEWGELPCGLHKQEATVGEAKAAAVKLLQHVPANAQGELHNALAGFYTTTEKRDAAWAEILVSAGARAWTQREKQTRREKERHMIDRQMTGSMCSSLRRRAGTMLYCAKAMANHGAPGAEGVILFDCIVL